MSDFIYEPNRGFTVWTLPQLWMADTVGGLYVANVGDMVVDWENGFYRVTAIDNIVTATNLNPTYYPTLERFDPSQAYKLPTTLYQPTVQERAFYNNTVSPFTIMLDDRYFINDINAFSLKLFAGTDTSVETGVVISIQFDGNNQVIGENVELEPIGGTQQHRKRPLTINTLTQLDMGSLVTAVVYNSSGGPVGQTSFVVTSGSIIRRAETDTKTIVDIRLKSDYISPDDISLLEFPHDIPVTPTDFTAVLSYNTGEELEVPVDGVKCVIHGLSNFNILDVGSFGFILLVYYPDPTEASINMESPLINSVSRRYKTKVVTPHYIKSLRVYVSPRYVVATQTYENTYWLNNIEHDLLIKLTPDQYVVDNGVGGAIDYTPSGVTQTLHISLDLVAIFGNDYMGIQSTHIVNIHYGDLSIGDSAWIIDYNGTGIEDFGINTLFEFNPAGSGGHYPIDLSSGLATENDWVLKMYYTLHPLFDNRLSSNGLYPTHFRLQYENAITRDIPVVEWKLLQNNILNHPWTHLDTVEVVWLFESLGSPVKRILGLSPVIIHNTLV